jgi:hypothetical protein
MAKRLFILLLLGCALAAGASTSGSSHGRWTAVERTGSFARALRSGTYAGHAPDRGAPVSFDVFR